MTPEITAAAAAGIAAVTAAFVCLASWRLARRGIAGIALAVGFAAGALIVVWPLTGPFEGWKWIGVLALVGAALGLAERRLQPGATWALRAAATVAAAWIVPPHVASAVVPAAELGLAGLATAWGCDGLARRTDGMATLPIVFGLAVATAVSLERGAFMDGAFLAGALAAATAAVFVLRRRFGVELVAVTTPASLVLCSLWIAGTTLADLPPAAGLLLGAAAPAAAIVARLAHAASPRRRTVLTVAAAGVVAVAALAVAAVNAA
jgi:hypothetical protein